MSTSGGKDIHNTGDGTKGFGPPTTDLMPPPPPGVPVPTPSPKTSSTSRASDTSDALKVNGHAVLVKGSSMPLDPPGNQPSAPSGADVMHHAVNGVQKVEDGSSNTSSDGTPVARANETLTMHQPSSAGSTSQTQGVLPAAGGAVAADPSQEGKKGKADAKKKRALAAAAAKQAAAAAGGASAAAAPTTAGDPVTVATGFVVDDVIELAVPGLIPVVFRRLYSSSRFKEATALGRGGWSHSYDQWIEAGETVYRLHAEDGRLIYFAKVARGESTFHRRERLTLSVDAYGGFLLEDARTRRVRYFAPSEPRGRAYLRRILDGYGNRVDFAYEGPWLIRIDDTAGRALCFRHDDEGRITRVEVRSATPAATLCQWVDYAYSPEGDLETATDALGGILRYEYDGFHRLTKRTLQMGVSFYYSYDEASGRCTKTVGDKGIYCTELHFNFDKKTTTTSGNRAPRKYTWTTDGLVTREETFDKSFVRVREYDKDQYLLAEANGAGERVSFRYDARGNLIERRDPANNATKWQVHQDRPIRKLDADNLLTRYHYDGSGSIVGVEYPTGLNYTLSRDARGRLVAIHGPDGLVVGLAYDEQSNVLAETDARGGVTRYQYDPLGRAVARVDALGRSMSVDYDLLGRRTAIRLPDDTVVRTEYDAQGRVTRYIDALGQESRMQYDGLYALVRFVEPTGQAWDFAYDELERLERIVNPRREEYRFVYNDAGLVEQEDQFHGRRLKYQYDRGERVSRIEYSNDTCRELSYDPLGNLIADESPHGNIRVERDARGRIATAILKDPSATVVTKFDRDRFGRVVSERQNDAELRFEYDDRGRRSARILPNGATTRYHYDPTGELVALDHDGHKVAIQRDVLGREVRRHVHDGSIDIFRAYDSMDRLVEQSVTAPGVAGERAAQLLSRRRLHHDANGRIDAIDDARWGTTQYRYDSLGQLLQATRGALDEVFEYDVTGSLHNKLNDLAGVDRTTPWRVEKGNVLTDTPTATYENDTQGRRTKKIPKSQSGELLQDEAIEYWWDCRDRLREVREADGRRSVYTYDAFGRRLRKELWPKQWADSAAVIRLATRATGKDVLPTPRRIEFWWDGNAIAAEVGLEEIGTRVHVHEPGTLVPMLHVEQGGVFAVVNDHLGMPKELIDGNGSVAWAAAHSAWATITETKRDERVKRVESPFRLLGQYFDAESGLKSTRFRYFDPEAGRWLSPDPLGNKGGRNLFGFGAAPSWGTDPLGLCIDYGSLDEYGRPTGITAILDESMMGANKMGSGANSDIKPPGYDADARVFARGHLLGNQLGGSGDEPRNLVTLYQRPSNSPEMSGVEARVRAAVDGGEIVDYSATPEYIGSDPVPHAVVIKARGSGGTTIDERIVNRPHK